MGILTYFFDTYALIEIYQGNPAYADFVRVPFVTSAFNLLELAYHLTRLGEISEGDQYIRSLLPFVLRDDSPALIWQTAQFKLARRRDNLSYADCLGYCYAQANGILFLTGDEQFKETPGVRFIK